jgi:hypothetical protein
VADGDGTFTTIGRSVSGSYEPLLGDFDGDQRADVFWYAPGTTPDYVWFHESGNGISSGRRDVNGDYAPIVAPGSDFDGSGTDDIIWYRPAGGFDYLWPGRTNRTFGSTPVVIDDLALPLIALFDDGPGA